MEWRELCWKLSLWEFADSPQALSGTDYIAPIQYTNNVKIDSEKCDVHPFITDISSTHAGVASVVVNHEEM